mmetsp:Transcript_29863/g.71012  ORF Transcript_29863/g.71012 Transcript_29863/m.71012 type:complete len:240 (-) Transcript_29863:530-1249(-)
MQLAVGHRSGGREERLRPARQDDSTAHRSVNTTQLLSGEVVEDEGTGVHRRPAHRRVRLGEVHRRRRRPRARPLRAQDHDGRAAAPAVQLAGRGAVEAVVDHTGRGRRGRELLRRAAPRGNLARRESPGARPGGVPAIRPAGRAAGGRRPGRRAARHRREGQPVARGGRLGAQAGIDRPYGKPQVGERGGPRGRGVALDAPPPASDTRSVPRLRTPSQGLEADRLVVPRDLPLEQELGR